MTLTTLQHAKRIKTVTAGEDGKGPAAHTRGGEYIKRARRRRLDLKTIHGTLRESARVYRELAEGKISLIEAETRSRVLRRHSEILTILDTREQVADIQRRLEALRAPTGLQPFALEDAAQEDATQTDSDNSLIAGDTA